MLKMGTKGMSARWKKAGALVAFLVAAVALGFLGPSSATASTGGPDDDGVLVLVSANQVISPGQVLNGNAGNMLPTQVFHVMPVPSAPTGCHMTTTREELIPQSNGLLTLFWEVKNIGSTPCVFTVRLSYTT